MLRYEVEVVVRMRGTLGFLTLFLTSVPALALQQTDGTVIPVLPAQVERTLVGENYGYHPLSNSWIGLNGEQLAEPIVFGRYYTPPEFPQFAEDDAITLAGLFKWRGEALDWQLDATAPNGAFTPHCPVTVEPVLKGGTCSAALGWYNVANPASPTPPPRAEIYELLPANLEQFLDCRNTDGSPKTDGFCPLAWDTRLPRNLSQHGWVPNATTLDLSSDARYQGGAIGFALLPAVATAYCIDAHYSVLEHNVRDAANEPYVTSIVYASHAHQGAFYLAFDDGVMLPSDWTNAGKTDGDYNDYVVFVSGCFEVQGGGPGAGGAAGADGAGASSDAGATSSGGDGTSRGGSSNPGGAGEHAAAGGDAAADGGRSDDGAGGSLDGAGAGHGNGRDGSSRSSGSCGCRLGDQGASNSALLGVVLVAAAASRRRSRGVRWR